MVGKGSINVPRHFFMDEISISGHPSPGDSGWISSLSSKNPFAPYAFLRFILNKGMWLKDVWILPSLLHSSRDGPKDKFPRDFCGAGVE